MSLYTRRTRASHLNRRSYAVNSADDEGKTDYNAKKAAEDSSENDSVDAAGLTLDDFGGRSDALGG